MNENIHGRKNAKLKTAKQISHNQILHDMLAQIEPVNFYHLTFPDYIRIEDKLKDIFKESNQLQKDHIINARRLTELSGERENLVEKLSKFILKEKHFLIVSIRAIVEIAYRNDWGLTNKDGSCYLFNGAYWKVVPQDELKHFLSKAAIKLGVDEYSAEYFEFAEKLYKQFVFGTFQWKVPSTWADIVQINLLNGTLEIENGKRKIKIFDKSDFMTYQMRFDYDPLAKAPLFEKFINQVLPDKTAQDVLFEFLAYIFISPRKLKLEKVLFLYGTGANGKSVIYEIVNALLGNENVTGYSLDQLTGENGYYRAMIANVRVNYVSEYNPANIEEGRFKAIASGEQIDGRHPYGRPIIITDYAKLIFNANKLPKKVEHLNAFFRRFLILPFDITIPKHEQDAELAKKIIDKELPGFLNLILAAMDRLLKNKKFTHCDIAEKALDDFKRESDSVALFIDDRNYEPSSTDTVTLKWLYDEYTEFCKASGYVKVSNKEMKIRLENIGYITRRTNQGQMVFLKYGNSDEESEPF